MASVQFTLSDTPTGGVSIHTNFQPPVGKVCTVAQNAALEILNRTGKQWGVEPIHLQQPATCRCFVQAVEAQQKPKRTGACKHSLAIKKPGALHYTCVECGEVAAAA
jgi:hypothetical protein